MARMIACPMLVAKQDPQIQYENVLVPVDFSDYSAAALLFASEVAPAAALHVFHALDSALTGRLRSAGVSDEGIKAYSEERCSGGAARLSDPCAAINPLAAGRAGHA